MVSKKIAVKAFGILAALFLLAASTASVATTYYVSSSIGDDAWEGTEPEPISTNGPWKTIYKVNEQTFEPGDIIKFKRGDTWITDGEHDEHLVPPSSGSDGNPITFTAYGEGAKPIFNVNGADFYHGIEISYKDYIVISDIKIRNFGTNYCSFGVDIFPYNNHIVVQNCTIIGENDVKDNRGINIDLTSDDVIVEYNDISLCQIGVNVQGTTLYHPSNVIIRYNTIHDMNKGELSGADGIHFENWPDRIPIDYTGTVIEYNHIYNCADHHIDVIFTQNITIRYNMCHGNVAAGGDGGGIKLSLHKQENPASTGVQCYFNIVYDTISEGICGGKFEGNFYNNVVFNNGHECMFISNTETDNSVNIVNNIFMNPGPDRACLLYYTDAINNLDNNCYWTDGGFSETLVMVDGVKYPLGIFSSYQIAAYPNDIHSIAQDPLFYNPNNGNFALLSDSPCIDRGTDISSDLTDFPHKDYWGNVVPNPEGDAWDIGAFEFYDDSDFDGILDDGDNCLGDYNPNQIDGDEDGIGDVCDNCPFVDNPNQEDGDEDGIGDVCDLDDDNDGICDPGESDPSCIGSDNCPYVVNPSQEDGDEDGIGDVCDNCPFVDNPNQEDGDEDGIGDVCDLDDDNDGICNPGESDPSCIGSDNCPYVANPSQEDRDEDGLGDICDNYLLIPNGPDLGTCVKTRCGMIVSYRVGEPKNFITCTSGDDCVATGGICDMDQGDCNRNGWGDAGECYIDTNDDGIVNIKDYGLFKNEIGRFDCPLIPGSGSGDSDGDFIIDEEDNCPEHPNGLNLGTCVKTRGGMMIASYRVGESKNFITCTSDDDCVATGGICDMDQGDCNGNGWGDVCECYADANEDGRVFVKDYALFKNEIFRNNCQSYLRQHWEASKD